MAKPTYHCKCVTLGKTKLGESDLIVSALREDGSLLHAVAKGARKPTSQFASRLDIFSVCDCLVAEGRSLDIFSEVKTVNPHLHIRCDYDLSLISYPIVQALEKTCHKDLPLPRVFDMTCACLGKIDSMNGEDALPMTAAFLLKLFAMLGFCPNFSSCVVCENSRLPDEDDMLVSFSYTDGGYVCPDCANAFECMKMEAATLSWAQFFLASTFAVIEAEHVDTSVAYAVLHLCHEWLRSNLGINLKSINALLGAL